MNNLKDEIEQVLNYFDFKIKEIGKSKPKHLREEQREELGSYVNEKLRKNNLELTRVGKGKDRDSFELTLKSSSSHSDLDNLFAEIAKKNSVGIEWREKLFVSFPMLTYSLRFYGFYEKRPPKRFFDSYKSEHSIKNYYLLTFEPGKDKERLRAGYLHNSSDIIIMKRKIKAYNLLEDMLKLRGHIL